MLPMSLSNVSSVISVLLTCLTETFRKTDVLIFHTSECSDNLPVMFG